jgi:hypothetical protein
LDGTTAAGGSSLKKTKPADLLHSDVNSQDLDMKDEEPSVISDSEANAKAAFLIQRRQPPAQVVQQDFLGLKATMEDMQKSLSTLLTVSFSLNHCYIGTATAPTSASTSTSITTTTTIATANWRIV